MIAEGRSYEQILAETRELTYLDIFKAAEEVLTVIGGSGDERVYAGRGKREKQERHRRGIS